MSRVWCGPPPPPPPLPEPAGPRVTVPHHGRLRDRICEALDLDDHVSDDTIVLSLLLRLDQLKHPA